MEKVSRSYDDWCAGVFPNIDTVKEVLQSVSTLSELVIADVYVQDGDDGWKILPVSAARYTDRQNIPAPTLEELVRNVRVFGPLQIISKVGASETEAWCNGFDGIGSTVADAVLRLYAKLLADKRMWKDRAAQPDRTEQDSDEKLSDEFLSYGWEPCASDGTDIFCVEKLFGDAYNEARRVVIVLDAQGMWHAEVYKTTPHSLCHKATSKYRSHVMLLQRLNEMLQNASLDDPNDR